METSTSTTSTTTNDYTTAGRTTSTVRPPSGDARFLVHLPPPRPPAVQYNPWHEDHWRAGESLLGQRCYVASRATVSFVPELLAEWEYDRGVLTCRLEEGHRWVSDAADGGTATPVTAADWVRGTFDLHRHMRSRRSWGLVEHTERTGSHTYRVFFSEPYRERYLLEQADIGGPLGNAAFYDRWLTRFEDATTDSERSSIEADLRGTRVDSPDPFTNVPFRVTETTDSGWTLSLREGEDPTPRGVDELTYRTVELRVVESPETSFAAFRDGRLPLVDSSAGRAPGIDVRRFVPSLVDPDVDFETTTVTLQREVTPGGYVFNLARQPTGNPNFRRAMAYLLDRGAHATRFMTPDRRITGYLEESQEERFLSERLRELLDDGPHDGYGVDAALIDAAVAELEAGGFEQDSSGRWLYRSGDRAGQPISLDVEAFPWMDELVEAASSFETAAGDAGIDLTVRAAADAAGLGDRLRSGEYEVALAYWGGRHPLAAATNAFFGNVRLLGDRGVGEQVVGPPVGEYATPVEAATDATETYDVGGMLDRLPRAGDDAYRELADRFAWLVNQTLPVLPVGQTPWLVALNSGDWRWPLPQDEHPGVWIEDTGRQVWQRGAVDAVPTGTE